MNVKITWIVVLSALLFSSCVSTTPKEPPTTEYTVVLEFPEKTANQLYDMTKMWLNEVFNDPNAVQSYSDGKDTISGKFEHEISYAVKGAILPFYSYKKVTVRYTMNIQIKDEKVLFSMKLLQWLDVPSQSIFVSAAESTGGNSQPSSRYDPKWLDIDKVNPGLLKYTNYEDVAAGFGDRLQKFIDSFGAGVDF